jgi:hypothetical protein
MDWRTNHPTAVERRPTWLSSAAIGPSTPKIIRFPPGIPDETGSAISGVVSTRSGTIMPTCFAGNSPRGEFDQADNEGNVAANLGEELTIN